MKKYGKECQSGQKGMYSLSKPAQNTEKATLFRKNETILGVKLAKSVDEEAGTQFHLD
jgi:hypothetical protein